MVNGLLGFSGHVYIRKFIIPILMHTNWIITIIAVIGGTKSKLINFRQADLVIVTSNITVYTD